MEKEIPRKYNIDLASTVAGGLSGTIMSLFPIMGAGVGLVFDEITVGLHAVGVGLTGAMSALTGAMSALTYGCGRDYCPVFDSQRNRRQAIVGGLAGLTLYSSVLGGYFSHNPDKFESVGSLESMSSLIEEVEDSEDLRLLFRN